MTEEDIKLHYLGPFIDEGITHFRINPMFCDGNTNFTFEEELLISVYIDSEMPYLKLYYDKHWKETCVKLIGEIPTDDKLLHYKNELTLAREDYYNIYNKIQNVLEEE